MRYSKANAQWYSGIVTSLYPATSLYTSRDVSDHQRHNQPQEGVHNDNGLKEIIP